LTTSDKRTEVTRRSGWRDWLGPFFTSDVGIKWMMALTGAGLLAYVLVHMIGNLKVFFGAEEINLYAESLRDLLHPLVPRQAILWLFRLGLIAMFGIHIWSAWVTTRRSHRANSDVSYQAKRQYTAINYANRTMRWGGVIIGVFVIYHLMHFTVGNAHPEFIHGNAYRNMVIGFSNPLIVGFYAVAMVMVAFHVYHGLWSAFQTVGANHPKYNGYRRPLALVLAIILFLGFMSAPLGVMTGRLSVEAGSSGAPATDVHELNEGA